MCQVAFRLPRSVALISIVNMCISMVYTFGSPWINLAGVRLWGPGERAALYKFITGDAETGDHQRRRGQKSVVVDPV